ncbi:MAG: hypothetical protein NUV60_02740 [Patescibacteria group bacterium]|nr:hypothetical protein [Patescibacteria group bacterium]
MNISLGLGVSVGNFCNTTLCAVAQNIIYLINSVLVPLLFAVAFIVFLYGIAKAYIFSHGNADAVKQGHQTILWGLIAFAVMISIWGLVNVVANTFGLSGAYAPPTPSSVSPYSSGGGYGQQQPTYIERCQVEGTC